ncbi:flavin-containing monooxygenase [Nonomuraea basaltis]|uniref:flavin-containing monooxygenase n=1 Tax=Nonomuraea basaltis TaxID=2495887 RepID=UPI00110C3FA7|nr:NAD(P)/FAD-dependent oxidoreductase [Nonomuraea basaltis]TMR93324.1 NAD(P)/FAD-dependent oxidoreductase [Nonomuraea basaltis]
MTTSEQDVDRFVKAGELVPLLCSVAELTGDRTLLADEFRPKLNLEMIAIPEFGGLSAEVANEAFERVRNALKRHFGTGRDHRQTDLSAEEIVGFLTNGADDYAELMKHELGDTDHLPWNKDEVAVDRDFVVGIVGAGQSGLAMARALRRLGIDFVMFEAADKVGGTWRWNAYPGCRLDTSTLAYSYSFFQRRDWRHYFAVRETLEDYFKDFAEQEQLLESIRFNSKVVRASWNENDSQWELVVKDAITGEKSTVLVRALISAVGFLNQPKIPAFNGLEKYRGEKIHSAEWHSGVEYRGKRVSIIGTGASAYQIAPAIVDEVESLTIFQRSAPWMLPAPLYHAEVGQDREWLMENIPAYHRWLRLWEVWHSTIGKYALTKADPHWSSNESVSEPNQRFRDALVESVRGQYVGHEDLLDAVIPRYPVGVKRMLRDNGAWARTLQRPQTALVTQAIDSFDEDGIRTVGGERHPADLTVFATGFHGTNFLGTIDVRGRGGLSLREYWGDESRAHKGVTIPGFPNLFCLAGPNTGLVAIGSQTFMAECGIHYITECLHHLLVTGASAIEPTQDAYDRYVKWIEEGNRGMAWAAVPEVSWYRNESGTNTVVWPYPLLTYYELTRSVDEDEMVVSYPATHEPSV